MRRVLVVAAVALMLVGGALAYLSARDHKTARFEEHLPTSSTADDTGFAVGRMHISGGPVRRNGSMPDSPVEGGVEVHHRDDPAIVVRVEVDVTGSFRIALPPGNYQLVARPTDPISPFQSSGFTIKARRTTAVDLVAVAT